MIHCSRDHTRLELILSKCKATCILPTRKKTIYHKLQTYMQGPILKIINMHVQEFGGLVSTIHGMMLTFIEKKVDTSETLSVGP